MSGNLEPGSDFAPIGDIAAYAAMVVAPQIEGGLSKMTVINLAIEELPLNLALLNARIFSLIP